MSFFSQKGVATENVATTLENLSSKFYFGLEQKTEMWHELREGHITASGINNFFSKPKAKGFEKFTETQQGKIEDIALFNKTVKVEERRFEGNAHTSHGNENEPKVKILLQEKFFGLKKQEIRDCGFVEKNKFIGFSPDGLIFDSEGKLISVLEIKCPTKKISGLLKLGRIKNKDSVYFGANPAAILKQFEYNYHSQLQFQMWCLGLEFGYFGTFLLGVNWCFEVQKDLELWGIFDEIEKAVFAAEKEGNDDAKFFIENGII